jgi:hypothetical protein
MCPHEYKIGTWDDWTCGHCGYNPKKPNSGYLSRDVEGKGPRRVFVMGSQNLQVRVNGVPATKMTVRRQMRSGYPDGPWEIVVTDPVIGSFAIDDTFEIEMKQCRQPWRKVFVAEVLTMLNELGVTH